MSGPLNAVQSSNAAQALVTKRYETGRIVSIAGGEVVLDVGAQLPDGTVQYLELPYSDSLVPVVGQIAGIIYPNDDPNAAYVVAAAESAQYNSIPPADPTYVFTITLSARITHDPSGYEKVAEWINQTGKTLTVLGVSFSMAQGSSPADGADFRINNTTQLTAPVSLSSQGTAVAGTLDGTPTIAPNDLAQLYVSTSWKNQGYCMILTVSAPL